MPDFICIPIKADTYNEFVLRCGESKDVAGWIENVVVDFLDRTRGDPDIWSAEHAERVAGGEEFGDVATYGYPSKGYYWQNVFLPNGTQLRMKYRGGDRFADVRHQKILYSGEACSPSEFVSRAANNTNRNAWRDIWIKRPNDDEWIFADSLRRQS